MNWIAFLSAVLLTIAAYVSVPAFTRAIQRISHRAQQFSCRQCWAELLVFLIAFALAAAPSVKWSIPAPAEADEFSYLLAADTFAHGRLTNPHHPLSDALESAEVIQSPTYASKYPPGQGLALAFGQVFFHQPIVGAWISGALACAAITWMLRAFVPISQAHWALFGGLLAATHPLIAWWNQSYWGGNVAMLGGTLLLGAGAGIIANSSRLRRAGIVCGIGLSILALSRPFEGAIVAAILFIAILLIQPRGILRALPWVCLALAPAIAFLGYYNHRVTEQFWLMPHALYEREYRVVPLFFWQSTRVDLPFPSAAMRDAAMIDLSEYQQHLGAANYFRMFALKSWRLITQYDFPPTLLIATIIGILAARSRRLPRIAVAVALLLPIIHLAIVPITRTHYFAPMLPAILALAIAGARRLPRPRLVALVLIVAQMAAWITSAPSLAEVAHAPRAVKIAADVAFLNAQPGKQLVLVHDPPGTPPKWDFIHNRADVDGSNVVFARSIDSDHDRALLEYFPNRALWRIESNALGYSLTKVREAR